MSTPAKPIKWSQLDAALRGEIDDILAAHKNHQAPLAAKFHKQGDEMAGFMLLAVLCALGGAIASGLIAAQESDYEGKLTFTDKWSFAARSPIGVVRTLIFDDASRAILLTVVALVLIVIWLRHVGRRGLVLTSSAIAVLRGPRVRVIPYDAIESGTQSSHGSRGKRFTVVDLKLRGGGTARLYTTQAWLGEAGGRIPATAA